jgi:hypothetical protein
MKNDRVDVKMTKEEHEQIELLIHDIERHREGIKEDNGYVNILNLSICIEDILRILFWILDKFPDEEASND